MKLEQLLSGIEYTIVSGETAVEIAAIHYDSRRVQPGSIFVCISGFKTDGHQYVQKAVAGGAAAILVEKDLALWPEQVTVIKTEDTRTALGVLASNFFGRPSSHLKVIGVTGTNGKTTTTHLIRAILEEAGEKTAIMGTLYARVGDCERDLGHTTPEAVEIEEFMAFSREQGARYLAMEVSSHALDLHRVDQIDFHAGIITNLTQDHLDYHHTMENYRQAKLKLFGMIPFGKGRYCVVNEDDPCAPEFKAVPATQCITFGVKNQADIMAADITLSLTGSRFTVKYGQDNFIVNIRLIGLFSVYNALAAIACAFGEGISPGIIKSALEKVQGVPGRFEQVPSKHDFTVIVDYAHTPDGLENILQIGRQITEKRMITVFGCGGDRDRSKRPLMGEIAARYSDFCVVTSDNPRSEEPADIINDIVPGLERVENSRYAVIIDRREAIRHAIHLARTGDLVIIAGKGHETYQLVKGQVLDFDDRRVAAEILQERS